MTSPRFWTTLTPAGSGGSSSRHYEILQEIASGGMATVYLGSRRGPHGFDRIVALKRALPPRNGVDPSALLAREAQLASRVHHSNVVSVIDVEVVDGTLLLVMEYVEGASLGQLIAVGPLPPRVLARILLDACVGLEAIHATRAEDGGLWGLVHRDVSPQNLLVGIDGTTRVADFGIATVQGCARTTGHGARRGKPGYMAPEYVFDGRATPSTDVFALAVTMWEGLTGRRLYGGASTLEELADLHQSAVPLPSELAVGISPAWDQLAMRAIERLSLPRFDTAMQLEQAILHTCGDDLATRREVASFVEEVAQESLWLRRAIVRERMRASDPSLEPLSPPGVADSLTQPEVPLAKRAGTQESADTIRLDSSKNLLASR